MFHFLTVVLCMIEKNFTDIGANLLDPMYQGIYHGTQKHQPDLDTVLERSWENNLSRIIITAGSVEESRKALELARTDGTSHRVRKQKQIILEQ